MITKEALLHLPKSNFAYGYDQETLHIRVRCKKNEIRRAQIKIGDPYIWEKGGADGGNLNAADAYGWTGSVCLDMTLEASTDLYDYFSIFYQPEHKRSRYAFILSDGETKLLLGERRIVELDDKNEYVLNDMANFFCFPYLNGTDVHKIPSWVKDTVWYQIFPDRFANHDASRFQDKIVPWGTKPTYDNFMGGDLQGIIDHLDDLVELGVNGIYLCPIFEANTNHRYDTTDYLAIDPLLGDKQTFKEFVEASHRRGIKIMLDAVFNHMGHLSPQWQDVVKHHEKSRYKDWFHIKRFPVYDKPFEKLDGHHLNYETFGRSKGMPKVNTENPEVIAYFLEVGRYWVQEFGIDAWRIDVANEVDHKFWRLFRDTIKKVNPEVFLLGEIWHDAQPWLLGDQFDVAMNYPLTEAMIQYFCTHDIDQETFVTAVNKVYVSYTRQVTENAFNLLDSHDTSRILTIANGNESRLKLAYLFMLTQQGSPCLYYGSEIPMAGLKAHMCEDHRSCMTFDHKDESFYNFMKKLLHIRKEHEALRLEAIEWLSSGHESVLLYRKGDYIIIINNGDLSVRLEMNDLLAGQAVMDCFTLKELILESNYEIEGNGYHLFKLNK